MTAIEIVLPNGACEKIVQGSIYEHAVPVVQRAGPPKMIKWGGFIKQDRAKSQLHARGVAIEIIRWSIGSMRHGWEFAKPTEFLQGCLVRSIDPDEWVVYGVTFGRKPRLLVLPGKEKYSG